jgi:stage II sporulation protein D
MIYGHGWGHGLGMSQWGANQMGRENISYQTILYHYYSNTKLEKLY